MTNGQRRPNDWYPTPAWATEILLTVTGITGTVLEPCVGAGHIANVLRRREIDVMTNDLDPRFPADFHMDALSADFAHRFRPDWVISNPPFVIADRLVPRCLEMAEWGVAMLLRLSWLEPTRARSYLLEHNPPTSLVILPRISFTGDGQVDNVTTAWFVWDRRERNDGRQRIIVVPRKAAQPELAEASA